jgi:hypothetical protein
VSPSIRIPTIVLAMFLLAFPVSGKAEPGRHSGQGRAMQLPATGQWYEGTGFYRADTPLDRSGPLGNGVNTIYLVDLEPGLDYTLGLRYPADAGHELSVELFDRWPFDLKARRYKLPMGPVVRTNPERIEYRWRLGVSGRSQGNVAFVVLQTRPRSVTSTGRFRHFMYLTTPAVRPMNQVGTGITYLRGPSDLLLQQKTDPVAYVFEYPYEGAGSLHGSQNEWRPDGNMIFNGDFQQGLQGWEMFSEQGDAAAVDHLASGKEGLRIWSDAQALRSGVRQRLQRDVQTSRSLVLKINLRIDKDPKASSGDDAAAVELTVCYLDTEGKDHCGDEAYRAKFTTHRLARRADGTIRVIKGEWFPFEDELMDLDPRPQVIKSVAVAGSMGPGQNTWIRQVHLSERGGMK